MYHGLHFLKLSYYKYHASLEQLLHQYFIKECTDQHLLRMIDFIVRYLILYHVFINIYLNV